jgi:hypothetical protein
MRRWLVSLSMILTLSAPLSVYATSPNGSETNAASQAVTTTTINNDFLNTERDIGECVGNSAEQPGCGREPTSASDRGGWLQYLTLAVMAAGLSFIFWRVARAVKARDAALNAQVDER